MAKVVAGSVESAFRALRGVARGSTTGLDSRSCPGGRRLIGTSGSMSPARWQQAVRSTGRSGAVAGSALDERIDAMNDPILWGHLAAVGAIVTASISTATQCPSASLGFHP